MPSEIYNPKEWTPDPSSARIPAPPPDLKVRTMQSDIEIMARRGGNFSSEGGIVGTPLPLSSAPRVPIPGGEGGRPLAVSFLTPRVLVVAGSVALLAILGVAAYYFSALISRRESSGVAPPANEQPLVNPELGRPVFEHQSLFRLPADQVLDLELRSGPVTDVSELQTYTQKLSNLLSNAQEGGFFELNIKDESGAFLSGREFFLIIDAGVMDPNFLEANFNPDFTAFVYKEKGALFPGYVLGLKRGLTALVLQGEVLGQIEGVGGYSNLFAGFPGVEASEGFRDKQIGTRPVRFLTFTSDEGKTSEFLYSWFNSTSLVLSTSEKGLTKAFELLGR